MKFNLPAKFAVVITAAAATLIPFSPAKAVSFGEKNVDQNQFIAVAAPFGTNNYNLLVIEQIPGKKQCWSESGSNPVIIDPLLLNFDFTGNCNRSTDSNGYSVRIDGQDYGSAYLLNIVQRDGELKLVGMPRTAGNSEVIIGRSYGFQGNGFLKIALNPGWQFTKRTYEGKTLGHVYFSGNSSVIAMGGTPTPNNPIPSGTNTGFGDIANDIYKSEIEQAVAKGFIAGFKEDNTFRPQEPLTREQLVSIVIEALSKIPSANVTIPTQASSRPYPDVPNSRWSAAKIEWAAQNEIVKGYPDGSFRPTQAVTRAELMAVLSKTAKYAQVKAGKSTDLVASQSTQNFADTSGHWAASLITQMSGYCQAASPLNETGNAFYPDTPSRRNYAAAATLRMLTCINRN